MHSDTQVEQGPSSPADNHVKLPGIAGWLTSLPVQMVALAALTRVALFLLAWQAGRLIPPVGDMGSPKILTVWGNWDTWHYVTIANYGYDRSPDGVNAAFFPLYPMMLTGVKWLFGSHLEVNDYRWVAVLLSTAFLLAATYALTVLFLRLTTRNIAVLGVVLFLISPFSFYFNSGYTEPVFIFLVVLTFIFARDKRFLLAAVIVALATATRVTGVFLIPALLLMAWKAGVPWKKLALISVVSPLGLLFYMIWQWINLGSPLRFYTAQAHWGNFHDRTWGYIEGFVASPIGWSVNNVNGPTLLLNVGVCLLWIATIWPMYCRFGLEFTLFNAILIAQAAFFIESQGRMLLPAIGVYITLAAIVEERPQWPILKYGLITTFLLSMTMIALMFANGQWIV